jgi:hypothetical protein
MSLYHASEGTAFSYRRACAITINNVLDSTPTIMFTEEDIITLPNGQVLHQNINSGPGTLSNPINRLIYFNYEPDTVIPLINPTDDSSLGSEMTHQQIMVALYSLYRQQTSIRDNVQQT